MTMYSDFPVEKYNFNPGTEDLLWLLTSTQWVVRTNFLNEFYSKLKPVQYGIAFIS